MKSIFIKVLKALRIYHLLQSSYRSWLHDFKKIYYRIRYKKFRGSGYQCNFCGISHLHFVHDFPAAENKNAIEKYQVIAGYGNDVICPYCCSTARERLVLLMLGKHFDLQHLKVLHFSPEKKIFQYLKKHALVVVSADLHPGYYRHVDSKIESQNLLVLSYSNDSFDVVIANHVMEHIPNDLEAMQEIWRVLKPGGSAILQVPISINLSTTIEQNNLGDPKTNAMLYGQKDHVRIYNADDYVMRLRSVGFHVERLSVADIEKQNNLALQKDEIYFMITKS